MEVDNLNWSLEYYEEHTDDCNTILNSLEDFEKIPLIDSTSIHTLNDGTLVRYRGMVQDMLNPEYYSCNFTVINKENNQKFVKSGKFRDIASCKINEELNLKEVDFVPKERLVFFCIPIPGVNDWVENLQEKPVTPKQDGPSLSGVKRSVSELGSEMEVDDSTESAHQNTTKRNRTTEGSADNNSQNILYDNNKYYPIPCKNGMPCIIKVYEDEEKSGFILNDVVDVVGFLSLNPALEANGDDTDVEDKALNPPPSLVPRIHAIQIKKLKHINPLLKQIIPFNEISNLVENTRSDLQLVLTQLLYGDSVAADYLICNLLSRIYIRNDSNTLGKFSLNLFNITSKTFCDGFYEILKILVTNSHLVSLSTNLLNEKSFMPRKDYESNRLWSGMLQLCDHVHLIVDETKLNEGQLNNTGCLNIAALHRLLRDQEVQYDFGYYPVTYNTDIPVLVLSEMKSILETDVKLKVKSEVSSEESLEESLEAVRAYLYNTDVLNKIRTYLTAVRLLDFELGEDMVRKIGEDYVSLRQQHREISSSDLHILLILSRLLALSHGHTTLKPEDWTQALEMETERKSRLRNFLAMILTDISLQQAPDVRFFSSALMQFNTEV